MGYWELIKVLWLIIRNLPTIIEWIKAIIDALDGDKKDTVHAIKTMAAAAPENKLAVVDKNGCLTLVCQMKRPE